MEDHYQSRLRGAPLYAIGLFIGAVGVGHLLVDPTPLVPHLLEFAVLLTLAGVVVVSGHYVAQRVRAEHFYYVVYSTLGLAVLTATVSWTASGLQVLQGYSLNEPVYYGFIMAAGGAAAGPFIGYYYARLQTSNAELNERYEEIRTLNERLAVLNRVLRHNLRNDVSVISGIGSDLQTRLEDEELRTQLELLNDRAKELVRLSKRSSDLRKVWETDDQVTLDVVSLLEEQVAAVSDREPSVSITTQLPGSARVTAHPRLETALEEVFVNALEHNDTSDLQLEVRVLPSATGDGRVRVEIADSGGGFPEIEQELFTQKNPSESPLEHGVGLGLWLVYWTVEKSDGNMMVQNDDGAVVRLDLPAAETDASPFVGEPTATPPQPQSAADGGTESPTATK